MKKLALGLSILTFRFVCISADAQVVVLADFVGADSKLFMSAEQRIYQYDRETNGLRYFSLGDSSKYNVREIAFDSDNNMYLANHGISTIGIIKLSQDGGERTTLVTKARDEEYWGIAYGSDNHLYATETNSNKVKKFDLSGRLVQEFAIAGPPFGAHGLAFDTRGNLLVTRHGGFLVYDDSFRLIAERSLSGDTWGISVRSDGRIYVAGGNQNDRIHVFDADYSHIGDIDHADLREPAQLAFDEAGLLYSSSTNVPMFVVFDSSDGYARTVELSSSLIGMAFERSTAEPFVIPEPSSMLLMGFALLGASLSGRGKL